MEDLNGIFCVFMRTSSNVVLEERNTKQLGCKDGQTTPKLHIAADIHISPECSDFCWLKKLLVLIKTAHAYYRDNGPLILND